MQLIPLELVKSNCDSVRAEKEKHISLKEVKPFQEPRDLNKKDETCISCFFCISFLCLEFKSPHGLDDD